MKRRPHNLAPLMPVLLAMFMVACHVEREEAAQEDEPSFIVTSAQDYLHDRAWRRAQLERSLWRPELPYARKRLAGYALPEGEGGWDLLPELGARVMPVTREQAMAGLDGAPFDPVVLAPEETPSTRQEWESLGERVFWLMPMRRDVYLEWVVRRPELWDEVGLEVDEETDTLRGVVRFVDARGEVRVGASCALCHGEGGESGAASRALDLGRARTLFAEAYDRDPGPYGQWGPGRVDVTDDGVVDALAIPDLYGVKHQRHLNSSGAIEILNPATLAVRFETQYIVGHSLEARPDRRLTWALAAFVMGMDEPERKPMSEPAERGEALFGSACAGCHDPDSGYSGDLIPATILTSDPLAADSVLRGTGFYKTPSLIGISRGGPFFHDASAASLEQVLEQGHPTGHSLEPEEREDLLSFLQTL